jgi:hypothetical protein
MPQAMGTPGFRGPEVSERGWSMESDVFAFGIIMWQLLTGLKPIAYDREWRMHLPHPRLLQFEGHIPGKLQQLALDCCRDSYLERPRMEEVGCGCGDGGRGRAAFGSGGRGTGWGGNYAWRRCGWVGSAWGVVKEEVGWQSGGMGTCQHVCVGTHSTVAPHSTEPPSLDGYTCTTPE